MLFFILLFKAHRKKKCVVRHKTDKKSDVRPPDTTNCTQAGAEVRYKLIQHTVTLGVKTIQS